MFCFIANLFLLPFFLCTLGDNPKLNKNKENQCDLLGIWTEVYSENDGKNIQLESIKIMAEATTLTTTKNALTPLLNLSSMVISQDTIRIGINYKFSQKPRSYYKLIPDPGGLSGNIDIIPFDGKGEKIEKEKVKGIYLLKDDLLVICIGQKGDRPKTFTTSPKSNTSLIIYRRGKLE